MLGASLKCVFLFWANFERAHRILVGRGWRDNPSRREPCAREQLTILLVIFCWFGKDMGCPPKFTKASNTLCLRLQGQVNF